MMGSLPESFIHAHMQWYLDVFINILSSAPGYALELSSDLSFTSLSYLLFNFQALFTQSEYKLTFQNFWAISFKIFTHIFRQESRFTT